MLMGSRLVSTCRTQVSTGACVGTQGLKSEGEGRRGRVPPLGRLPRLVGCERPEPGGASAFSLLLPYPSLRPAASLYLCPGAQCAYRHVGSEGGQGMWSKGRLGLVPDDHSVVGLAAKTKRSDPAVVPVLVTLGARSGRHSTAAKVPTMAKSTRGAPGSDSGTRTSAVKITPADRVSATVPPISSLA